MPQFYLAIYVDNALEEDNWFPTYAEARAELEACLATDLGAGDRKVIEDSEDLSAHKRLVRTKDERRGEIHSFVIVARSKNKGKG